MCREVGCRGWYSTAAQWHPIGRKWGLHLLQHCLCSRPGAKVATLRCLITAKLTSDLPSSSSPPVRPTHAACLWTFMRSWRCGCLLQCPLASPAPLQARRPTAAQHDASTHNHHLCGVAPDTTRRAAARSQHSSDSSHLPCLQLLRIPQHALFSSLELDPWSRCSSGWRQPVGDARGP